jgi:hypothetical protein
MKIKTYKNINGTISDVEKRVGFCRHRIHLGYLTKRLMEEHECIEKKCPFFIKYEKNAYWIKKDALKQERTEGKKLKKQEVKELNKIMKFAKEFTRDYLEFALLAIYRNVEGNLEIRYVSINKVDLNPLITCIYDIFEEEVKMVAVKNTVEMKVKLIGMHNPESLAYEDDFEDAINANVSEDGESIIKKKIVDEENIIDENDFVPDKIKYEDAEEDDLI